MSKFEYLMLVFSFGYCLTSWVFECITVIENMNAKNKT